MDEKTFKRLTRKNRALYVRDPENNYNQVKIGEIFNFMFSSDNGIYLNHEKKVYVLVSVDDFIKLREIE